MGLECERTTCIDIPEVNPEDVFLISVLLEDGLKALLETIDRGLACAEDGEARKLATELIRKCSTNNCFPQRTHATFLMRYLNFWIQTKKLWRHL